MPKSGKYQTANSKCALHARSDPEGKIAMAGLPGSPVSIVLVHGGFVDGAGWEGVYNILKKDGYNVSVVQNPTTSLADDVAATRLTIARAQGPCWSVIL